MSRLSWAAKHLGPWFWAKFVIGLFAVVDVVVSARLADVLTTQRPLSPHGLFIVPYQTHGGVTYISAAENVWNITLLGGAVFLVLVYQLIRHFEKRAERR